MRYKKLAALIFGGFCLSLIVVHVYTSTHVRIDEDKPYKVIRVIDGDTFEAQVEKRVIIVRMLGIDTPESVHPDKEPECFGIEASNETKRLLNNHAVRFKLNPKRELKDRYGRYLLYVYGEDNILINKQLIENGFAEEFTFGKPYSKRGEFVAAEKSAKNRKAGLWGACSD